MTRANELERADIQGLILRGYQQFPQGVFVLVNFSDQKSFCAWLQDMAGQVATGTSDSNRERAVHVALTVGGVALSGVELMDSGFPRPFLEGMTADTRSKALGDVGENSPTNWLWDGETRCTAKALLLLYARSRSELERLEAAQMAAVRIGGGSVAVRLPCGETVGEREHFGFRDGIGQPIIAGMERTGNGHNVIQPGEFVLGYRDEYGLIPPSPTVPSSADVERLLPDEPSDGSLRDLGRNGTFMVVRQMEQRVAAFWATIRGLVGHAAGTEAPDECIRLAAKMVGRWPGGAPLTLSPDSDDPTLATENRFGYRQDDTTGSRCPHGAHIRRSNPRDSLAGSRDDALTVSRRHRILRRGRSYGPKLGGVSAPEQLMHAVDDKVKRGLYFICCNTDIERQFEFVQQTWIDNPKFAGLRNDPDPLVSTRNPNDADFTVPNPRLPEHYTGLPNFVRLRGGAYFFLPGIRALRYLGTPPNERVVPRRG